MAKHLGERKEGREESIEETLKRVEVFLSDMQSGNLSVEEVFSSFEENMTRLDSIKKELLEYKKKILLYDEKSSSPLSGELKSGE